jgi:serine/threonine-protein kinase
MSALDMVKRDLLDLSDFAYGRLRARLDGMTTQEYLWEPVDGCWSVRPGPDGTPRADGEAGPVDPAPFTTIAWRICHLTDVLAGQRNATWIGVTPAGTLEGDGVPATAPAAIDKLERAYDLFRTHVGAVEAGYAGGPDGRGHAVLRGQHPGGVRPARARRTDPPRGGDRRPARSLPRPQGTLLNPWAQPYVALNKAGWTWSVPDGRLAPHGVSMTELLDGRYRLVEQVARGGSSTVWRGYDERLSRPVAVKIFTDPQARWNSNEAKSLALLTHPHIATVFDVGESAGRRFLVTEFVAGRSLASVLAAGPLPWPAAVACCEQIASALAAAHARGLVHRDVTPANIMLTAAGAKLIDFGISAFEGSDEADPDGQVRGTPPYAAPERLTQHRVGTAADVYGLGAVLHEALSGRLPGESGRLSGEAGEAGAALDGVDGLPDAVAQACLSCLAPDPTARPTAPALADVLHAEVPPEGARVTAPGAVAVPPRTRALPTMAQPWRRRPSRPVWLTAAAVLLVGLLAGLAIGVRVAGQPTQPQAAAAAGPACAVNYQITSDNGNTFAAAIVATNTGRSLPAGWRVTVAMPSGQASGLRPDGEWVVDGGTLASPPQTALGGGGSARITLTARHTKATVLPTGFDIAGRTCSASLLGPDGSALTPGAVFSGTQQNQRGGDHGRDGGSGDGQGGPGHG